ncbi:hypothetical protein NW072_00520 [Mycoplasmopsis felis]|nr:hypothetical protein [Mycoplasmopsis felis]UWV79699.1 hypothetical protein NW072_00520 [Mycoplasmopsis felis]
MTSNPIKVNVKNFYYFKIKELNSDSFIILIFNLFAFSILEPGFSPTNK